MKNDSRSFWRSAAAAVLMIALLAGAYFAWNRDGDSAHSGKRELRSAPALRLPDASGAFHTLEEFRGRPVVVHFWAAWCPPCLEEIQNWVEFASTMKDRGFGFIAVSLDPKWEDALKILPAEKVPPGVLSLIDTTGKISEIYGTFQFPETYLLTADHRILYKWVGAQDWKSDRIRSGIESALKNVISGKI